MKTLKNISGLTLAILLGLAATTPVPAFQIELPPSFVPAENIPHLGQPIHEEITRDAITNVTPAASPALIANLQRGVENPDIIHQFDSESHFDNCSVPLNVGFSNGFATMNQRFAAARPLAMGNPEFLSPHYTSFLDISADVVAALTSLSLDPDCLLQPACPTAQSAADAIVISALIPALAANPNPDPHRATNPRSLFYYPPDPAGSLLNGYFGPIQEGYLEVISTVESAVNRALGNHFDPTCLCNRNLADVMGASNSHVVQLQRLKNALRAYHAFQNLGHALHAAQDFFAHSDYVEVMAGVSVGQGIPPGTIIPVPVDFSQFNLTGLQTLMGSARFNLLESGEVLTIWLGDGDFSLGNAGIQNVFNPNTAIEIGGVDLLGYHIPAVTIPAAGQNPKPFPGFNHGHYLSSAAVGLNKDGPSTSSADEPSHQNYLPARQAAVQMSTLMWAAFLQSIGELAAPVLLTCPADKVVATDTGKAYATGVNLGAPSVSGGCETPGVTNDAPAQFPKGTNLVHWVAGDSCGNSNACTQTVVVLDLEPPQIVCSTNRVAAAIAASGAVVIFPTPAATDNCPGVQVVCLPVSGSTFQIGNTTVVCTAIDTSGNQAACSFTIHVKGAVEQIQDLMVLVKSFHLASGIENSLLSPLKSALDALSAGNKVAASGYLQTFIDHVNAQSGKKLTTAQARSLVAAATQIKAVIK
jgi:hypothetical protein